MALQNDTSRIQYNGNNSTVNSYAIPFVFFENAHIKCVVTTSAGVDTELTLGSTFNVTGAGNTNGGSLTTTAAVPTSSKVTIFRNVPATQTTSYQEGGDFPAASHERALDKLTMIAQQTKRLADRALKVPETQNNPNDLPNAGAGNRLLGSNNGTLTWEENRQLPAYPGNAGQKLLSAPGGGAAPSWQDAPSIAVGPITPTGALVPRFISDRFADVVNVIDFGADPTGATDSWLAIQRAVAASGNHPEWNPETLTINDTILYGNKNIPKLFFNVGTKKVIFPAGTYRVSRSIVVGNKMWLEGQGSVNITPTIGQRGQFNLIEDNDAYIFRELDTVDFVPYQNFSGYGHGIKISNLYLKGYHEADPYPSEVTSPKLSFLPMPLFNTGPGASFNLLATGTAGASSLTLTGTNPQFAHFPPYTKIKIRGHNTEYTVVSRPLYGTTVNVSPNLTTSFTNQNVLLGIPANNGIFISAGEEGFIDACNINGFQGAGIYLYTGTPSNVIRNCMSNVNDVGYWLDSGTANLFQPSGDGNNTFLRAGWHQFCGGLTCTGMKVEDPREFDTVYFVVAGVPYPFANKGRETIELGSFDGSGSGCFNLIGGTVNRTIGTYRVRPEAKDRAFISCYRQSIFPHIRVKNIKQLGYGENFLRIYQVSDGTTDCLYKRSHAYDYDGSMEFGTLPTFSWYDNLDHPPYNGMRLLTRNNANDPGLAQIMVDQGSGFAAGSDGTGTATFSRTGTTATFTLQNHSLQVGDYINCVNYSATTPAGVGLNNDQSGPHPVKGYFTGSMRVQTVANANTFTTTVLNSGATAGSCRVKLYKFSALVRYRGRTLEQQMPTNTGPDANALGFAWIDKREAVLAGLRVPTEGNSQFWTTNGFLMGGTPASPEVAFLHGADAPSASAPNGSIYLRTGGDASTTMYVRANNAWWPLAAYQP